MQYAKYMAAIAAIAAILFSFAWGVNEVASKSCRDAGGIRLQEYRYADYKCYDKASLKEIHLSN